MDEHESVGARRLRRSRTGVVAAAIAAAVGTPLAAQATSAAVGPAHAVTVGCGDVLTQDARLTHDLNCSDPVRLVGGADLDLAWHTLSGSSRAGVVVEDEGSVVRNGTITGFHYGVFVGEQVYEDDEGDGAPRSATIRRVSFTGNEFGVRAVRSPVFVVASTFRDNVVGVETAGGGPLSLSASRVSGSQVAVSGHGPVTIEATVLQDNQIGLDCGGNPFTSRGTVWAGNSTAVAFTRCGGSSVVGNVFSGNGTNFLDGEGAGTDLPAVRCSAFFPGGAAPELPVLPCPTRPSRP